MKSRIVSISITICLLLALVVNAMAITTNSDSASKYVTVENEVNYEEYLFIPFGDDIDTLGCNEYREQVEMVGPKSFVVSDDGSVYILDTLNESIKQYSAKGRFLTSISLPDGCYGLDMDIADGNIYLMCDDRYLYKKNLNLDSFTADDSWEMIGSYSITSLAGLYAENDEMYGRSWDGSDLYLSGMQAKTYTNRVQMTLTDDGNGVIANDNGTYTIKYAAEPIGTYIVKTIGKYTYILEQEALLDYYPYAEMRIGKYENEQKIATALPLSTKEYNYSLPFKKLYVTDNGEIYQMVPVEKGVVIYSVPWYSGEKTRITQAMVEKNAVSDALDYNDNNDSHSTDSIMASSYATRTTALTRAYNMAYYSWNYDASNHYTPTGTYTKSPSQLTSSNSGNKNGIPYCWGGMNGIDTGTYSGSTAASMKNFTSALSGGQTAGNVNTSNSTGHVSSTAGLDCSGLIAAAYKFTSRLTTGTIPNNFTKTTWANAQEGDAANSTSHVFMLKYKYSSGVGNYMMSTYESVSSGSIQGVILNYRYYNDVVNSYTMYGID